ncbi:hypothetical protein QE152_g38235 [Popillia japonica]|uniref:Uncharacterized protein n=1 Tax=Popillia japonica TaxID=7064 RepID=A0AAW1I6R8_POPJA
MLPGNITAAFKKCGIYPYDRHIFTDVDLLPSSVTDRPIAEEPKYEVGLWFSQTTPRTLAHELTLPNIKQFVSPEDIRGYLKAEARKSVRQGRKKGKSIIADTPEKKDIEEKYKKR